MIHLIISFILLFLMCFIGGTVVEIFKHPCLTQADSHRVTKKCGILFFIMFILLLIW
jgi:hypothetical protein